MKAYEQTNNNQEDCVDATPLSLMQCYTWVILTRTYNQNMPSLGQRPQRWDNFPQKGRSMSWSKWISWPRLEAWVIFSLKVWSSTLEGRSVISGRPLGMQQVGQCTCQTTFCQRSQCTFKVLLSSLNALKCYILRETPLYKVFLRRRKVCWKIVFAA